MPLDDWIKTGPATPSGTLTREALQATMDAILARGSERRHSCLLDGHVAAICSRLCVHCGLPFRELTVDENHLRLGEFW